MSKYVIEINERSKGKALKMLLECEESIKILPYDLTPEIPVLDSTFKSWEEFNQGFGIGRSNPANLKNIREKGMVQKVILDSNIIIDIYNGNDETRAEIQRIGASNLCISIITYGEAIYGALNKTDRTKWKKHLDKYSVLHINDHIGSLFIGLMDKFTLSHNLMIPDALIAATAIYYKLPLFSNNKKDFEFIPNLVLYKNILDV